MLSARASLIALDFPDEEDPDTYCARAVIMMVMRMARTIRRIVEAAIISLLFVLLTWEVICVPAGTNKCVCCFGYEDGDVD